MATIQEVARKAGVSIATVSYVLNGKDRVSAECAHRVRAAVAALGYVPSGVARKLRRGRTGLIGLIADNISNRFPARLAHGLATAASAEGYNILISDLHDRPGAEVRALEVLVREQVEAIIYCGFGAAEERLHQVHRSGTPVVVVDKPPRNRSLPSVLIDNAGSIRLGLEHLLALGHRRIRFISGNPDNRNTLLRNEAFTALLRGRGLRPTTAHILTGNYSLEHGFVSAVRLTEGRHDFSAVVCGDDMIAFGAMAGFKSRGLRIPQDVAVVGFADDPLAAVMDPGLTTIRYPVVEMGQRAFEVFRSLRDRRSEAVPREQMATSLVVRGSTDPTCPPFEPRPPVEPSSPVGPAGIRRGHREDEAKPKLRVP